MSKASDYTLEEALQIEETTIKREYIQTEKLYDAIEENNIKQVKQILGEHPEYARSREPSLFYSPLHFAVKMNRVDIALLLVKSYDVKMDQLDKNQNTALYYAVTKQNQELCDAFLSNEGTKDIDNPFAQALKFKFVDIIKLFLKHRPMIVHYKNSFDMTIFHKAAEAGSLDIFCLISKKYEEMTKATHDDFQEQYEAIDRCGMNVFLHAVSSGSIEMIQYFVDLHNEHDYEIKFALKSNLERSAMHYAIFSRNINVVEYLHHSPQFTFDLDLQDSIGKTPLHYAVDKQLESIVRFLITNKVRIDLKDKLNKKPIHYVKKGKIKNTTIAEMIEMRRRETESIFGTMLRYIIVFLAAPRRFKWTLLIVLVCIALSIYYKKGILVF
mmetsp:Transcript_7325/g.10793  ORF Transcript_7325/g.10793 Transcript_7325/m.10793 type:complete len:384 (-) Transcript_7325:665-1816(-)